MSGMEAHRIEEILEHVWTEREEGRDAAAGILRASEPDHAPAARDADLEELVQLVLLRSGHGHACSRRRSRKDRRRPASPVSWGKL